MPRSFKHALMLLVLLALVLTPLLGGCSTEDQDQISTDGESQQTQDVQAPDDEEAAEAAEWAVTLLDGYPEDAVPLYESTNLDTCFFSVRNDPSRAYEGLRNYYHVVFNSGTQPADVLEHYRGLMDSVDEESTAEDRVEGTIAPYEVIVRSSEWNEETIVYLTVDLPASEVSDENRFFADHPADLVETPEPMVFFEEMFYRVSLEDNDMKYTRHFYIADRDGDGTADIDAEGTYAYFEERYADMEGFSVDRESGKVVWIDGKYQVTVAHSEGSDRGVLVLGFDAE